MLDGKVFLRLGDCREVLKTLPDNSIDSVVTDPPYALVSITKRFGEDCTGEYARASAGFMGKQWDTGETAFAVEFWQEVYRVLKPGGHVVSFSGTRTYHRMAVAIEDAGFEIRDSLYWHYGSGFPKSHNISKAIDKAAGAERKVIAQRKGVTKTFDVGAKETIKPRDPITASATPEAQQWDGWGTALKPATEPICLARKPLSEKTVAANVLKWGTGAINIDGCRVGTEILPEHKSGSNALMGGLKGGSNAAAGFISPERRGRFPANIIHDGSDEVTALFPDTGKSIKSELTSNPGSVYGGGEGLPSHTAVYGFDDSGSAARFFYTAKADATDRIGSKHPTVKPVDLMQWLCRLITPPGGTVLDPFAGSGTTGEAAWREGFKSILVEREKEYQNDIQERMRLAISGPDEKRREIIKRKGQVDYEAGPLFETMN